MAKIQKGLGRGLDVFFGEDIEEVQKVAKNKKEKTHKEIEKVVELNISEVEPMLNQPRKVFDKEKLEELVRKFKTGKKVNRINVVKSKLLSRSDYLYLDKRDFSINYREV